MAKGINVYSEIGQLKKVLVHRPGDELRYVTPARIDELLMSAIIEVEQAQKEHDAFTKILRDNGVEVLELADLAAETYKALSPKLKEEFLEQWLAEASWGKKPATDALKLKKSLNKKVLDYLRSLKPRQMIDKMMAGILMSELGEKSLKVTVNRKEVVIDLAVDPMPNLYFTRDPFACVGNGITLHNMKYPTRKRETIFGMWIFKYHPEYKDTPLWFDKRSGKETIEGGDVFIYTEDTLAIGVSERTNMEAILKIAKNIQKNKECNFKKIIAINVPPMGNLMHLDTWLTMLDKDVFLYSGNIFSVLKVWEIDLTKPITPKSAIETKSKLPDVLSKVVGRKVKMVPIAGEGANQMDIDIETHFDGTNYLVIKPGVVVGYDRNRKTEEALKKAGVKVLSFNGNQLSLGMGSARCMSMPFYREHVDFKK